MAALVADQLLLSARLLAELAAGDWSTSKTAEILARWAERQLAGEVCISVSHEAEPVAAPVLETATWRFALGHEGRTFGAFEWRLPPAGPTMATPTLVKTYADAAALMLAQCLAVEAVKRETLTDHLTGLGNRRRLEAELAELIDADRPQGAEFGMLLFDVDHFKRFNDTWGHHAGDCALRQAADLMRGVFRQDDVVCRYGGDEFAVILCDRRHGNAAAPRDPEAFAERLIAEAERQRIADDRGAWLSNLSLSCGIATFPWDAGSAAELLRAADAALLDAKRAGRHRIGFAGGRKTVLVGAGS